MLDAGPLVVASLTGVLAIAAGALHWPSPPQLDGERWFKLLLATLLRGEVEANGGDAAAWAARVVQFAPYHPAGREPERKVAHPATAELPGPALPGERALLEALARQPTHAARWAWMYDTCELGLAARLDDPEELGPAYAPSRALAASVSWDDIAAVGAGDHGALAVAYAKLGATWVVLGAPRPGVPDVAAALLAALPEARAVAPHTDADALAAELRETEGASLVIVAEGEAAKPTLAALVASPELRDRVAAVLLLGPVAGGDRALDDWFSTHLRHTTLDTELVRLTPYLTFAWLDRESDPPGGAGVALHHQRLPAPDGGGPSDTFVQVVDLGVLPLDPALPTALVARALVLLTAMWVRVHRG